MKQIGKSQSTGVQKNVSMHLIISLSCLLTFGLFSQSSIAAHDKVYEITILHTNDYHACFRPISIYDNNCSAKDIAKGKCFGGTARLITAIEDAR